MSDLRPTRSPAVVLVATALVAPLLVALASACAPGPLARLPAGEWRTAAQGEHVRYLVLAGVEPAEDPERAVARLEAFLAEVAPLWGGAGTIDYYAFPDRETLERLTGWRMTGRAILDRTAVVSIYAADAHEVAHLLSAPRGRPLRLANFWLEGVAMAYTWPEVYFGSEIAAERPPRLGAWQGRTVHGWARDAVADGIVPPLTEMIHFSGNRTFDAFELGYPVAGSFVSTLIGPAPGDERRIAALRTFFDDANVAASAEEVAALFGARMGSSLEEAEGAWHAFLQGWAEP
jgi:hypothetical protein